MDHQRQEAAMRPIRWRPVHLMGWLLAGLMGGLSGCTPADSDAASQAEPPPVVQAFALERAPLPGRTLQGTIEPRFASALSFRVGGKLIERGVDVGDRREPGAVLMRLDPTDYQLTRDTLQADMQATRSEIVNARAELARLQRLFQKNLTSEQSLDQAKNHLNVLNARLKAQQRQAAQTQHQIDYTSLRVPEALAGPVEITSLLAEKGEVVRAGQPVLRLASVQPTEVKVALPRSMRANPPAQLALSLASASFSLSLKRMGDQADAQSRTWPAWYGLADHQNHQAWLKQAHWGETVTLSEADTPSAWRVPVSAVLRRGSGATVWRLLADETVDTGYRLVALPVTVVSINHQWAWIETPSDADLMAGDELVAFGAHRLHAGQTVRRLAP
ncbi:efflux RND transporter periplasmic adaptor subunit [Thiomicrospira sp. WB1]|uniref:efflux RND transporter periplasmic adaptor subunit n=1 Tax=Thiomicrospira sp. WB1 TaxID=1685380 RepID=UPI000747BF08|nr:efflux RND transporter periplasmic adaptor subunit [Thiomicrospira sp. WB1]KUJ72355.1 hypothetical protein AVO41_00635 [Thiomicrospira sp. WB1]